MKLLWNVALMTALCSSIGVAQERQQPDRRPPENGGGRPGLNQRLLESVNHKLNIPYAANTDPRQQLDLLMPKEPAKDKLPVIVFIHGGGWRNGDKARGHNMVAPFVESGNYIGASINYRLTNQAQWPAQIHDCKAAIRWLRGNAKEYGIDPDKIAVMGTSAGGHLVAMMGTSFGVQELEGDVGEHDNQSSKVTAVINYFGPAQLATMDNFPSKIKHNADDSPEALLLGGAIPQNLDKAKSASPQTYVSKDDAVIMLIHGTDDPLVPYDQSVQFDKALDAVGVESTLITIKKGGHQVYRIEELDNEIGRFLDKHLRLRGGNIREMMLSP